MTLVIVGAVSFLTGAWAHRLTRVFSRRERRRLADRRLGLLGAGEALSAEARRAFGAPARWKRLVELGKEGTFQTHNCGEILHVDYERGILTCARDGRH